MAEYSPLGERWPQSSSQSEGNIPTAPITSSDAIQQLAAALREIPTLRKELLRMLNVELKRIDDYNKNLIKISEQHQAVQRQDAQRLDDLAAIEIYARKKYTESLEQYDRLSKIRVYTAVLIAVSALTVGFILIFTGATTPGAITLISSAVSSAGAFLGRSAKDPGNGK